MSPRFPRVSLFRLLLLSHLGVALPAAAIADQSIPGSLALGIAVALSISMARLLTSAILQPIRAMTAELQVTPKGSEPMKAIGHGYSPTEIRELIETFGRERRGRLAPRRRASDVRSAPTPGLPPDSSPVRSPARPSDPALIDPLTGLANRRGVAEHLANVDGESPLEGTTAVLCLALVNLASVAAAQGPDVASALLRAAARRITQSVRDTDLVARIGPGEIAIVQHDVRSRDNALSLAQRIRTLMAEPLKVGDRMMPVSIAIGIALAPSGSQTYTARLIDAEMALQKAKLRGPGAIAELDPGQCTGDAGRMGRKLAWA